MQNRYKKTCQFCKRDFMASRSDARYCSASCRARASRALKYRRNKNTEAAKAEAMKERYTIPEEFHQPQKHISARQVLDAFRELSYLANFFEVASSKADDNYRDICELYARYITELMRKTSLL